MPTPPYILELREHIGHELLLLPGVAAVVVRETEGGPQVLLGRAPMMGGGACRPGLSNLASSRRWRWCGRSLRRPASWLARIG